MGGNVISQQSTYQIHPSETVEVKFMCATSPDPPPVQGSGIGIVYRARPISLAYWKLELGIEKSELLPTAYTQLPVSERNGSSLID